MNRVRSPLALVIVLSTGMMASAFVLADAAEKFTTNYERGESGGNAIQNNNRDPLWADDAMVGKGVAPTVISANVPLESGLANIPGNAAATASNLLTVFERMEMDAEFQALLDRVKNGGALGDVNYGHDGHLNDLNLRADQLEQLFNAAQGEGK